MMYKHTSALTIQIFLIIFHMKSSTILKCWSCATVIQWPVIDLSLIDNT